MQFQKVSCISCAQYHECPQKTRLFVNYCGSDVNSIKQKISDATGDCRIRRGQRTSQNYFRAIPALPALQNVSGIPNG